MMSVQTSDVYIGKDTVFVYNQGSREADISGDVISQ